MEDVTNNVCNFCKHEHRNVDAMADRVQEISLNGESWFACGICIRELESEGNHVEYSEKHV